MTISNRPLFHEVSENDGTYGTYHCAYNWLHIPTGKTGSTDAYFLSRERALKLISNWNAQQPLVWKYWL
jgi:hypothetical protein